MKPVSGKHFYHIAVQRAPLPWMTKFKAIDHFWADDKHRLTIVTLDGEQYSFARMTSRRLKIYANYKAFVQRKAKKKQAVRAVVDHVEEHRQFVAQETAEELPVLPMITPETQPANTEVL